MDSILIYSLTQVNRFTIYRRFKTQSGQCLAANRETVPCNNTVSIGYGFPIGCQTLSRLGFKTSVDIC